MCDNNISSCGSRSKRAASTYKGFDNDVRQADATGIVNSSPEAPPLLHMCYVSMYSRLGHGECHVAFSY